MASRVAGKIKLQSVDELLGVPEIAGTQEIEIGRIHAFPNHPFKVLDDEKMDTLVDSIRENGILNPVIVRPDQSGNYEMISGHRRLHAAKIVGLKNVPAIVKEMSDDEAIIKMVDANIQREEILPSERAFVVQDQVWGRVTENRIQGRSTRYYMDEMHLLLREDQTAAYTVEIWKRFRKWGGIPTGITQNVKDLLASKEVENIFENSDFIYMLNQAVGDRQILAKQLNISPHQLSYVTHSGEGEGLLFYGNVILPFVDRFPANTELYRIMTTRLSEVADAKKEQSA